MGRVVSTILLCKTTEQPHKTDDLRRTKGTDGGTALRERAGEERNAQIFTPLLLHTTKEGQAMKELGSSL
jgi:hypothetical protein